jgi:thiamine transport system permease protein
MAGRRHQIARAPSAAWAGAALGIVVAAVLAGLVPVATYGLVDGLSTSPAYLLQVAEFTLLQATLSTILSIILAVPVARALSRRAFAGRALVLQLFTLPLAIPAIVAVLGIVQIYGTHGWLAIPSGIYGLRGIVLAHVFFNLPLSVRMLLLGLSSIPPESWRLAAQLGFRDREVWQRIEWPQIKVMLPGTAVLIFLLCTASFTVVLTLGGGPAATTLEVAIYQALRFDFDPPRAAALALVQLAFCATLVTLSHHYGGNGLSWPTLRLRSTRYDGKSPAARLLDGCIISLGTIFVGGPLLAIAISGVPHLAINAVLLSAVATSLGIASVSATVALTICWPLAQAAARRPGWARISFVAALGALVIPPAVLATGWFILLSRSSTPIVPAPVLVVAMNALSALPFVYNILAPAAASAARQHDRLCASLGISGLMRLTNVDLPALRKPLGLATVMAAIVSLGDLTAIALFGSQNFVTLPALIYRQMGSYRMESAAGTAFLLGIFTVTLIAVADRWSKAGD